jgi:uncharacterized protein YqhQ
LEALYGSQFEEITKQGKNGASGRLNGNLFLMAFVIVCVFALLLIATTVSDSFMEDATYFLRQAFGNSSGKTIGKLLAIPLMALVYFVIIKTVGSEAKYQEYCRAYLEYPEAVRQKATMRILKPFFVVLGVLFLLAMFSLF